MTLYKLFSCNVEVQYKSYFLSKAMFFTVITTILTIILPFIIAYRGRGFWLKSASFYEKPSIHFSYDYLIVLETEDPSKPIVCSNLQLPKTSTYSDEYCTEIEVQEKRCHDSSNICMINFKSNINLPTDSHIISALMLLGLDFQLTSVCPLHMQSLAVITREFAIPSSGFIFYGDIQLYQTAHLSCPKNVIHTKYNHSLLYFKDSDNTNFVDTVLRNYYTREVTTQVKTLHSRSFIGHSGTANLEVHIKVPETEVLYIPNILQELKWAWPQYLSLLVIFYWLFNQIKRFVFNNRLLMAWEIKPWKK